LVPRRIEWGLTNAVFYFSTLYRRVAQGGTTEPPQQRKQVVVKSKFGGSAVLDPPYGLEYIIICIFIKIALPTLYDEEPC